MSDEELGAAELELRSPTGGTIRLVLVCSAEDYEITLAHMLERGYVLEEEDR